MNILNERSDDGLKRFLLIYKKINPEAKIGRIYNIAKNTIRYLNGNGNIRKSLKESQQLENLWYKSLENNNPDFNLYDHDYYLSELWACWRVYSRKYIMAISDRKSLFDTSIKKDLEKVKNIVDLGCGIGYTSAALKLTFPNSNVIGTNIEFTKQSKFIEVIKNKYQFDICYEIDNISKDIDLIFASEYFEHIQYPIYHLHEIVRKLSPRYFLIANSFNTRAIGHFNIYADKHGAFITNDKISRIFNREMRSLGYEKIKTRLWNNRPTYWKRLNNE